MHLFQDDPDLKKFLSLNLKDKITLSNSIQIRDLMTALVETLDIEEARGDIIRYALNSEIFYAFPLAYLISLL